MEQFYYLVALIFSISGLLYLDYKYKLAFWFNAKRTAITLAFTMALFIVWDIVGISFGIFFIGESRYMLPIEIFPEFPIEELFFLFLLSFVTLLIYRKASQWQRIS